MSNLTFKVTATYALNFYLEKIKRFNCSGGNSPGWDVSKWDVSGCSVDGRSRVGNVLVGIPYISFSSKLCWLKLYSVRSQDLI